MMLGFFKISGIKRLLASAFSTLVEVLSMIPGTSEAVTVIQGIAALFGITGLSNAAVDGTLTKKKLAGASAALSILIIASYFIPVLTPFTGYFQHVSGLLAAAALGAEASKTVVVKPDYT